MKTILFVVAFMLGCSWAESQEWQALGLDYKNQIWPGNAMAPSFAMDGQGNLYVGFLEDKETHTVIVSKYEEGQWTSVGVVGFSEDWSAASIAVSPDGTVYTIGGIAGALVTRFNGTRWEAAGTSSYNVSALHIAVAADGTPYLAALDRDQANKATVLMLSGDTWQTVGQAGFTSTPIDSITIEMAPDGTPYVTCLVNSGGNKGTVMRFTDGVWQTVGQPGIRRGAFNPSLTISGDGTPYLAYSDSVNHYKATVVRLEDNDWQPVGNEGFSAGFAVPDIAIDKEGTPYVAYADSAIGGKMIVRKFNGSSWETAGNAGFSNAEATYPAILISPEGTPYVAYADRVRWVNEPLFRVKVSYLDDATWRTAGQVSMGAGGLAVTPGGIPTVAYHYDNHRNSSVVMSHKTSVISYNGSSWEKVGQADYLKGIHNIVLTADHNGTPYIAYNDSVHDYRLTVARFDGTDWETVGQPGFTDKAYAFDITVDKNETPWVAQSTSGKYPELHVFKFNGNEWETVGELGYTWYGAPSIVTDNEGIPYVLYSSAPQGANLIVRKWEDTNWVMVGDPPVADIAVTSELLAFDSDGRPMIGYQESDNLHIKVYENGQWTSLSTEDIEGKYVMEVFASQEGKLYTAALNRDRMMFGIYQYDNDRWGMVGDKEFAPGGSGRVLMDADASGNLYLVYENQGIWAYKYEHPLVLNCPENDTLFNDTGTMVARRSYNALPEGIPDTMAVYSVEGKESLFRMISPLAPQQWR
jgi:hypothetical protein